MSETGMSERLAELRRSFDESFAVPSARDEVAPEDMLAVDVSGARFAVRVSELAGVHVARKIVALPDGLPGLAGLVGIRGRLVAAYRLSDFVAAGAPPGTHRWLLACGGDPQVGLLIDGISAYVRAVPSQLYASRPGETVNDHVREILMHEGSTRGVLSVPSVLAVIARRASAATPVKES